MVKKIVVACSIFKNLIEQGNYLSAEDVNFIWLEAGLHSHLNILEEKILNHIQDDENVKLLYCKACLPDMLELAKKKNNRILDTKNCLTAMVGEDKIKELEKNKAIVITPDWIRVMWNKEYSTDLVRVWDGVDFRMNFGRYDKIIVLDPQLDPLTDEEILECFDLVGVPIEVYPCDLGYFNKLMENFLA